MALENRAPGGPSLGWSVGRPEWLDDPSSKVNRYWRTIEYGSAASGWPWAGKRVVGLWGPSAGTNDRPGRLHSGELSMFSDRDDQKFVPFFKEIAGDEASMKRAGRSALLFLFGGGPTSSKLHFPNEELIKPDLSIRDKRGKLRAKTPERARLNFWFWLMTRARLEDMPFVQGKILREVEAGNFYRKTLIDFHPLQREVQALKEELGFQSLKTTRKYQGLDAKDSRGREVPAKTGTPVQDKSYETRMGSRFIVNVSASGRTQDNIRDAFGRFTSGQAITAAVNKRLALQFQEALIERMSHGRERPSTGDLIEAHGDANNRLPH
jgi:hypothetical protein